MERINQFKEFYKWAEGESDPRTQSWLLVHSPLPTYAMSFAYILFATRIGPWLMRDRQPMNIKWLLVVYNLIMAVMNAHIFYELLVGGIYAGYSFPCQVVNVSNDHWEMRIASAVWLYYISKLIEFLDTIFFVLRKKNNQISFLHVYHHSTMPLIWWIGAKWVPGGSSGHAAMFNAFIHIVMYFYYGVAALGPQYQKYIWWKKYLTQMQLIQFVFELMMATWNLRSDCQFPHWMNMALLLYMISFLFLFGNFYVHEYFKKKNKNNGAVTNGGASNGVTNGVNKKKTN